MNPPSIPRNKVVSISQTVISVVGWGLVIIMILLLLLGVCSGALKK